MHLLSMLMLLSLNNSDIEPPKECTSGMPENSYIICDDGDPYNGYWWWEEQWVPGYVTIDTWFTPAPFYSYGNAVFYAPYIMRATADKRNLDLSNYVDGVAMASPADIGLDVWINFPDIGWTGPYLVVDCARRGDIYPITMGRGEVVELGFRTALEVGMVEWAGDDYIVHEYVLNDIEVSKIDPKYLPDIIEPVHFPSWWETKVEFSTHYEYHPIYVSPTSWKFRDSSGNVIETRNWVESSHLHNYFIISFLNRIGRMSGIQEEVR